MPGQQQIPTSTRRSERHARRSSLRLAGLIAFAVLAYVVLDGFDLGISILFPLIRVESITTSR